ncbi:MAG: hypothetical protein IT289_00095 [Oligoflexia bacterium]|nr:hypothetical protein [Oligoflexia bacterium]
MKSVSVNKPKALLPVGHQTFIDWQLQWLKCLGMNSVALSLGHGGEVIEAHLRTKLGSPNYPSLAFVYDGPELLGTGGAVKKHLHMLDQDFIVTYGDTIVFAPLNKLMTSHKDSKKPLTIVILENRNQGDKSNVVFTNQRFHYDKFKTTPEMHHIDSGMLVISKEHFKSNSHEQKFDLASYMTKCCEQGLANPFLIERLFIELGSPAGYENFKKIFEAPDFSLEKLAKSAGLL